MNTDWDTDTAETSNEDKSTVNIDKWNQKVIKYKDSSFVSNSNDMYD